MARRAGGSIEAQSEPASKSRRWSAMLTGSLLVLAGVGMALPGLYLATLGGSLYYAFTGALLIGCAWLAFGGDPRAPLLYALILIATLGWSLWEVGIDGWALMPRLVFLIVGGVWLLIAPAPGRGRLALAATLAVSVIGVGGFVLATSGRVVAAPLPPDRAVSGAADGDWTSYGNVHSNRYSPLDQITPANVAQLEPAWTYHAGLLGPDGKRRQSLQLTPLVAEGLLYGCTAFSTIYALDPVTGREIWRRDAGITDVSGGHPVCRSVSFFRAPAGTAECPTRILLGTFDNRLIALDAKTGKPCAGFGTNGATNLRDNMGDFPRGWAHPTSPPTIVNGIAVIGHYIVDNQTTQVPPGVIRGYDALTGALRWAFDPGRPNDPRPPGPGQNYTPSTPNSWTTFSGDPALGLVYVPMGNGSPDFIGGLRSTETNRFATTLVALDAATGRVRWTFQAVHHDLWDYDLSAQPALVDFPVGGSSIPALILPTKTGQLFVLDRRTGKPLTRIDERPAPGSVLSGERPSPTQPWSVGMPDFVGARLTEADMWGLTPFDQLYCRILFRRSVYDGIYTPMQTKPTLRMPGELGGIDWGSVAIDERRGLLIVNSNHMADRDQLIPRAQADREGLVPKTDPRGHFAPGAAMAGTPYGVHWGPFLTGLGVPCQRPPYGKLSAIDLRTRRTVWAQPLGDARNSGAFGIASHLPIRLGAPNIGGALATGGGLTFIAATQDEMFRAFDTRTGRQLWSTKLPAAGHASPMSFRGRDGHQYILIAAGGQALKDKAGDALIAYRLGRP